MGELASRRQKTSEETDSTWDRRPWAKRWFDGLRGEYAFCRFVGLDVDVNIYERRGDAGYDLKVSGRRCDVKALQHWLVYTRPADFTADVAVLTHLVKNDVVRIVGYIER